MSMEPNRQQPEIVLSMEFSVDPPGAERDPEAALARDAGVAIVLDDGRRIALDPANPRSPAFVRVISSQGQRGRPISLELDGPDRLLRLFLPHISTVSAVHPLDRGGVGFGLTASHAMHRLNESNHRFDEYHQLLLRAMASDAILAVTEGDDHVAIDIRIIDIERGPRVVEAPGSWLRRQIKRLQSWCLCGLPWRLNFIRESEARKLFDLLAARSCDPQQIDEPCIPFLYPDNGCWARAHEMCRMIASEGYEPCKIWIEGRPLNVQTANHPFCEVFWYWHVAPVLCRRTRWAGLTKLFAPEQWVFDPSMFDRPVTVDEWKAAMGNPDALLTITSRRIYHLWGPEQSTNPNQPLRYDDDYENTSFWLWQYHVALLHRVLNPEHGPPPYDCDVVS